MDYYRYLGITIIAEYIDLIKAFDKMILKNIMNDLWRGGIKGKIWRNIYEINRKSTIKSKHQMAKLNKQK